MRNEKFWAWFDAGPREKLGGRSSTFAKMFEYLDGLDHAVTIIETGCSRRDPNDADSWSGDGCSTILFDRYIMERGRGSLISVDIDPKAVKICNARLEVGPPIAGTACSF